MQATLNIQAPLGTLFVFLPMVEVFLVLLLVLIVKIELKFFRAYFRY